MKASFFAMSRFWLLMALAASLGGTKAFVDHRLQGELDHWIHTQSSTTAISYQAVYLSFLGSVVTTDLLLTPLNSAMTLQVGKLILPKAYQFYRPDRLPHQVTVQAKKIQFQIPDKQTTAPDWLTFLGYAPYYLSLAEVRNLGYPTLAAEGMVTLQLNENLFHLTGTIDIQQLGKLTFTAELQCPTCRVTNGWFARVPQMSLVSATLTYQDDSFCQRALTQLAQRNKMTVDHLKQKLTAQLNTDLKQLGMKSDQSIVTALTQFVQKTDTLTLSLFPPSPLAVTTLLNNPMLLIPHLK